MRDKAWECRLHRCLISREKQVQPQQELVTLVEEVLRHALHTFQTCSHNRKSSRDPKRTQEPRSAREKTLAEHQDIRDHLKLRADTAAEGEEAACVKNSLKRNITPDYFLRRNGIRYCSGARSEINMQELNAESADRTLRESNLQVHSHRLQLYQATQMYLNSWRGLGLAPCRIGELRKSSSRNSY